MGCWGLACCNFQDRGLFAQVADETVRRTHSVHGKPADLDLPQIACSFAKVKMCHGRMLDAIAMRMLPRVRQINDWGLCALKWSYDTLDNDGRFLDFRGELQKEATKRSFSASDVASS